MAQVNKISSFKSFTEIKNQETTMKLREENNAKRQETVGKIGAILDEMGLTSLSELDEDRKQALISKMFGNVSEDEAENIEDEINKLGEPKKLEERNAFLGARAKAIEEDKTEFEFNGKVYKVTVNEGNAFGDAVRKAKEAGEKEFEFDGKTYKVEEGNAFLGARAKAIEEDKTEFEFNGKVYKVTVNEGNAFGDAVRKAKEAGEKEFEFDGKTYKVEEGNAFGDAVRKAKEAGEKEFEFDGKTYKVEESLVSEGVHGMATKLLRSLVDGETSKVEGVKMSKELAQHYIDWIRTSPYGKKNGNLPLNMLIDASFNWGIERGTDANLKSELKDLKGSIKESFLVTEGTRGQFGKIDKKGNITTVYTQYDSYPENVLPIIKKSYKNVKDVDAVIAKGDNSGLEVDFDKINFYGKNAAPYTGKVDKIKNFIKLSQDDAGAEYIYLFDERNSKWYMVDIYGGAELVPAFESFESVESIDEARSITKIQNEWSKLTTSMQATAQNWKAAEGAAKEMLLGKLKEMTAQKKGLEAELEAVIADKDKDLELAVTEGATKQFDVDFNDMVKNIKSGYGWIDPEYVADTWENSSDTIDYSLVKGEILKRLFNAGLLMHSDPNDEEVAGKKVKFSELGAYAMAKESIVNEAEVKSDDEFKEYAMTVLKKAFGADFDEAKGTEVIDGILKKCDGDYGACVGMLTSSLGESVTNEATNIVKILRKLGWAGETWTPQELASQIKNLDDSTLIAWSKDNKGIPNTPLAFQMKLVDAEMEKRGLSESFTNEDIDGMITQKS